VFLDCVQRESRPTERDRFVAEGRKCDPRWYRDQGADPPLQRLQQAFAGTRDTATNDHGGWVQDDNRSGDAAREPLDELVDHFGGRLVSLDGCREHHLGVDRVQFAVDELMKDRVRMALCAAAPETGKGGAAGGLFECAQPVLGRLGVKERKIADFTRRAARSTIDVPSNQDAAADANADLSVEGVVDALGSAEPALGER